MSSAISRNKAKRGRPRRQLEIKDAFARRLRQLVPDDRFPTQRMKADAVGLPVSTLRAYWNGEARPTYEALLAIIESSGCSADWLLRGKGSMFPDQARPLQVSTGKQSGADGRASEEPETYGQGRLVAVPVLKDPTMLAPGHFIQRHDPVGYCAIRADWCPHPAETECVLVADDSMAPSIPSGGIIAIDRSETRPERLVGRIVAIWQPQVGMVSIRRLYRAPQSGRYVAVPDNPTAENGPFDLGDDDSIIGRVRAVHAQI